MRNKIRKHFTQIPNALINDKDIDRSARFLFVYLCSKPDNWKYFTREIENGLGCSKDTRVKYMNILISRGWITTSQKRNGAGTWEPSEIELNAVPKPQPKKDDAVQPQPKKTAAVKNRGGETRPLSNTNLNNNIDLFSNKEGKAKERLDISKEILNYLNEKKPSKIPFKIIPSNLAKIKTRIKEGYTLEDFKKVIDFKVKEWSGEDKTRKWLRPETLFSTKFNGYLIASRDIIINNNGSNNFKFEPTEKAQFS